MTTLQRVCEAIAPSPWRIKMELEVGDYVTVTDSELGSIEGVVKRIDHNGDAFVSFNGEPAVVVWEDMIDSYRKR